MRRVVAEGRAAAGTSSTSATACLPDTDPDVLTRVVDYVHEHTAPELTHD